MVEASSRPHFKKALYEVKASVVSILVAIYFGSPLIRHTIKANCMKLQIVDPEISLTL